MISVGKSVKAHCSAGTSQHTGAVLSCDQQEAGMVSAWLVLWLHSLLGRDSAWPCLPPFCHALLEAPHELQVL